MTIACIRDDREKRPSKYVYAVCVARDNSDFGKIIEMEIPDGYIMLLPASDDVDRLRCEVYHLREELEELELGAQIAHPKSERRY